LLLAANPDDPSASDNFVLLGKTYEGLQKRIADGRGRIRDEDDLEDWEDDEDDEYGEAQVCHVGSCKEYISTLLTNQLSSRHSFF